MARSVVVTPAALRTRCGSALRLDVPQSPSRVDAETAAMNTFPRVEPALLVLIVDVQQIS